MKIAKSYGAEERISKSLETRRTVRHMYTYAVQNQAEVSYWFNIGSVIILSLILFVSVQVLPYDCRIAFIAFSLCPYHAEFSSINKAFNPLSICCHRFQE